MSFRPSAHRNCKMLSRTLRRSLLDIRIPSSALPPKFLLPSRARYFNSTAQTLDTTVDSSIITQTPPAPKLEATKPSVLLRNPITETPDLSSPSSAPLSESVKELLPLLVAQPSHFITAHIHARPYLVTPGDLVRLPFHMPHVVPGDILRLNRASVIGSRDYTLKGAPYVDERIFECRATVVGTEGEPVRIKIKKKQRNRRTRIVRSKHKFTVLRISELRVKTLEEIEG